MTKSILSLSISGMSGLAMSGLLCIQPSLAGTSETIAGSAISQSPIELIAQASVLPSQRPRYLSGSNGTSDSRFSSTPNGMVNPWGLGQIGPQVGIVALSPGETDRTAANQDLGARAAGATHGHAPAVTLD